MQTIETSLSYPIGRHQAPEVIDTAFIQKAVSEIEALPWQLRVAVRGLKDDQLDTPYRPEGWTVRQVVHHLADSHMNAFVRFKLTLTEDTPAIKPYMEAEWAKMPDYEGDIEVSLRLLEALHLRWVMVLKNMRQEDWQRAYFHPEAGKEVKLGNALSLYAWHGKHHTAHITRLRERAGW